MLVGTERLRTMVLTCSLVEYVGASGGLGGHPIILGALLPHGGAQRKACPGHRLPPAGAGLPRRAFARYWRPAPPGDDRRRSRKSSKARATFGWGESIELERERFGIDHCEVGRWIGVSWNFPPALLEVMVSHHHPRGSYGRPALGGCGGGGRPVLCSARNRAGSRSPRVVRAPGNQDQVILQACLPQLKPDEADKLAEMLETDFLHLIQFMEFGAAGLFGGGIPKNPFREYEG